MIISYNSLIGGHNGHKSFNFIFQYDNKQEKWEKLNEVALVKERAYHAVSLLDVCSLTPLTNESYCGCKKEIGGNDSSATIETVLQFTEAACSILAEIHKPVAVNRSNVCNCFSI